MGEKNSRIPSRVYGFFFGLCVIYTFVPGCDNFDQTENNPCIIVGTRRISTDELRRDLEVISAGMDLPAMQRQELKVQLIEQIIDHYLILEYGKENSISISKKELKSALNDIKMGYTENGFKDALLRGYVDFEQWKDRLGEQLLIRKVIRKVTEDTIPPSYQEIKHYFEENMNEFSSPPMLKFRQIVTSTKDEAENILKQLYDGEDMSELAREYSIAPEAEKGGEVGWVAQGHLEESMEKVLFSMPQGKPSPVIETPYGYHIFEVLSVRPEGFRKLPEVIQEIESRLLRQNREKFLKKWLRELRTHFEVRINQDKLNTLELS